MSVLLLFVMLFVCFVFGLSMFLLMMLSSFVVFVCVILLCMGDVCACSVVVSLFLLCWCLCSVLL